MAVLEELQAQVVALTARVEGLAAPPDDYYTLLKSGEEVDDILARAAPGGAIDTALTGKAPAGYGLGGSSRFLLPTDDLDDIRSCGWYFWTQRPVNAPDDYGIMVVGTRGQSVFYQEIVVCLPATPLYPDSNTKIRRICYNWIPYPWEWVNPPMIPGVEYRTTERYFGRPVYSKLINCGTGPAAGSAITIEHGIADMGYLVDFCGVLTDNGIDPLGLPYFVSANNQGHLRVEHSKITIIAGSTNLSGYTDVKVRIKCTKNTD